MAEGCFTAVDFIDASTSTVDGVDLTPLTCASGDAAVLNGLTGVAAGTFAAGKTLNVRDLHKPGPPQLDFQGDF